MPDFVDIDWREFWNTEGGEAWVRNADLHDAHLAPFGEAAMRALDVRPGEHVLDIGCGGGATTRRIGQLVSPGGSATGVDVSEPIIGLARQRLAADPVEGVRFELMDAQRDELPSVDAVFSRFGVMFFDDLQAGFANLHRTGGRLAFATWQGVELNPWMLTPVMAAMPIIGLPELPPPDAPGPFTFADADRTRRLLTDAGWKDPSIEPFETEVTYEGMTRDEVTDVVMEVGPLRRMLEDADDETRTRVRDAVAEAMGSLERNGAYVADAAAWVVSARP